jgi:hypothetical protein
MCDGTACSSAEVRSRCCTTPERCIMMPCSSGVSIRTFVLLEQVCTQLTYLRHADFVGLALAETVRPVRESVADARRSMSVLV